eukprot:gnl/Dysnectes_brevis/2929_a3593_1167.p1 GENE.gnl/Dysnectes_brevis/2929_a3593_1167~~gnl/Dysnectes_brevis/2929_a3593_1167.p1  ORF type:complete len:511 (+),score=183.50 gnl/Dysnectes_brevis/2929_a3593_1167:169-1533(+)
MVQDAVSWVSMYLPRAVLPPISGHASLLGNDIEYTISSLAITDFYIKDASVQLDDASTLIDAVISNGGGDITFEWSYKETDSWPYIGDNGFGEASITDISAMLSVYVYQNECQTYNFTLDVTEFDFSDVSIHLSGGASWLYDLIIQVFIDLLKEQFMDLLPGLITQVAQMGLDSWSDQNTGYYWLYDSDGHSTAYQDWRMPTPTPIFKDNVFVVPAHGQTYRGSAVTEHDRDLFWQTPLPLPDVVTEDDVQYIIDRSVFNSVLSVFQEIGSYNGVIDDPSNPLLQTDTLSAVIPGLAEYPGDSLRITLNSTQDPLATIMPTAVFINMTGTLTAALSSTGEELFTLAVGMGLAAQLDMFTVCHSWGDDSFLYFLPELYNQTAAVVTSALPGLELTADTQQLLAVLLGQGAVPWLADQFKYQGVVVPQTLYFDIDRSSLYFHDTFLVFASPLLPPS